MTATPPLPLPGCGLLGRAVAQPALAEGREVWATTRSDAHGAMLADLGIRPLVAQPLRADVLDPALVRAADVLVTFPPDGVTDAALAPALRPARALAYISSTAVYGATTGVIDAHTPAKPADARGDRRLAAEQTWRSVGAMVLRAPAIYGPGQGLHQRLRRGNYKLPGDGDRHVSRIHVDDLATISLAALARGTAGSVYLVGDLAPCTHRELVAWLSERLGIAMPAAGPEEEAPATLRGDRRVDPSATLASLGVALAYPDYRVGYAAVLEAEKRTLRAERSYDDD